MTLSRSPAPPGEGRQGNTNIVFSFDIYLITSLILQIQINTTTTPKTVWTFCKTLRKQNVIISISQHLHPIIFCEGCCYVLLFNPVKCCEATNCISENKKEKRHKYIMKRVLVSLQFELHEPSNLRSSAQKANGCSRGY